MAGIFLKIPQTAQEWRVVAMDFRQKWDFPHCVRAIDGKHIVMKSPINSGSLYYNYKGTLSIVLMALVDASNIFLCADIRAYGRQSDAGVFANTELGESLNPSNRLNLPPAEIIEGAEHLGAMPYVVVGDEPFPQQQHVMRPYPGKQYTMDHHAYNYRHSRARRIVECAFGILATRWRVFYTKMAIYPENVESVVQGTVILHNMLRTETTPGTSVEDLLQEQRSDEIQGFVELTNLGTKSSAKALDIRNRFKRFFIENPLSWQNAHIQRGLH
ncbi:protein ALP1-like [Gigantopelta aegis]|uniref:protein ALP1-like n=1 Tax=Gigantopelta aegis TaxID=1735272 RepID=UPI001B889C1C|nr:protein ALP1-like [Gigantopelta aegis]